MPDVRDMFPPPPWEGPPVPRAALQPRPAYMLSLGPHDWYTVKKYDWLSAESAARVIFAEGRRHPEQSFWYFKEVPINAILLEEDYPISDWVMLWYKYQHIPPERIRRSVLEGTFPEEDISILEAKPERFPREILAMRIASNFLSFRDIEQYIKRDGYYFPPILESDLVILDGAHRLAVLSKMGLEYVYAWVREPEEEARLRRALE